MNLQVFLLIALVVLFVTFSTEAQRRHPAPRRAVIKSIDTFEAPTPRTPEQQKRLDCFMAVWRTIRDYYFDPTFNNLNWENIRTEFEPRVRDAADENQFYALLNEMIARLNKSHFAIIRPEVFDTIRSARLKARASGEPDIVKGAGDKGIAETGGDEDDLDSDDLTPSANARSTFGVGVELRILDNKFVITRVGKNSAAEYHGLKPGFIIEKVNGVSLTEMLQRIDLVSTNIKRERRYLPLQVVNWFLNGKDGTSVSLTYIDETNAAKEVTIRRERLPSELLSLGKDFPRQNFEFNSTSLSDEIGYIRFNLFAMPVIPKFCSALTEFKDKKALIIDLRGNIGGVIGTMFALGGMLTDSKIDLGTEIFRVGSENLTAAAKQKHFAGPIVVLIDDQSVSSAEVFSAALKENARAIIVGERSAGEALPAVSVKLPTGAVLIYPIANFKTHTGGLIEGKGVEPTVAVALSREQLLKGIDPQLAEAVALAQKGAVPPTIGVVAATKTDTARDDLPPPPVMKEAPPAALRTLGSVTVKAPPPKITQPKIDAPRADIKDTESLKLICDFFDKIGGEETLRKITSFEITGNSEILFRGSRVNFSYVKLHDAGDRYAEFIASDQTGEIRQVYSGKNSFVQSDFGADVDLKSTPDSGETDMLAQILLIGKPDTFRSLTYRGSFDRGGRKAEVVEAVLKDGSEAALAFDTETKLLVSFTKPYMTFSFADYRKTGSVMLPFYFEIGTYLKLRLNEIKVNVAIDASRFEKKKNCFDIAN